ncbi:MAG: hypothetical protein AAF787_03110 [Chloroflexota bacterium]
MSANKLETFTLNRILGLDWQGGDPSRQRSQLALFNEYLRRCALWSHALNWNTAHPVASDFPGHILPDVRATPVNATLMQQTLRTLGKTSVYERMLLTHILNWSAIADSATVRAFGLPDLYEPVLLFYERGGWLNKSAREGEWEISGVIDRIDRASAYHDLPPLDIDEALLDELDAEHRV